MVHSPKIVFFYGQGWFGKRPHFYVDFFNPSQIYNYFAEWQIIVYCQKVFPVYFLGGVPTLKLDPLPALEPNQLGKCDACPLVPGVHHAKT